MASTISTTITARIPNEDAAALRDQAARFGLSPSKAIAALIRGAVLIEQLHEAEDGPARP